MADDLELDETDRIVAEYIDRLNGGDRIQPEEVLLNHPRRGGEILAQLEAFVGGPLGSAERASGRTLGDYTLRRVLGRGGMGVVYDAWQQSVDRRVALKVLPTAMASDSRAVARFLREAQAAGRLAHQNIVPVHAIGVSDGAPYYAMEFVEGETLAEHLKRVKIEQIDQQFCLNMAAAFAGAAEGLQHAHERKVIHRDLKPSNLMLDGEADGGVSAIGRLRILDFGLARIEGQETITLSGDVLGTPQYMSPEQARRKQIPIDRRTDIYSLGATLYEALTLRPPFRGKDHNDTLSQIIERDPAPPRKLNPRIPQDLETIVLKCLRKEPADRYGTAEALGQELRRLVRGEAIEARAQTRWATMRRKMWRRRVAVGFSMVMVALVAALSLVAIQYTRTQSADREAKYLSLLGEAAEELHLNSFSGRLTQSYLEGLQRDLEGLVAGRGSRERLKDLLTRLDEGSGLAPHRSEASFYRARVLVALDRDEPARAELGSLVAAHPTYAPAHALLALLAERRGEKDLLAARLEVLRGVDSDGRAQRWREAQSAAARRDWPAAATAWAEMLKLGDGKSELYPGADLDGLVGRGVARINSGDLFGASGDFAHASGRWPGAVGPLLLEAHALLLHKDEKASAAAEAWLQTAFERVPHRDEFALRAAGLYLDRDFRDATKVHAWIDRIAQPALAERTRLAAHVTLGEWQPAVALGEKLLAAAPEDSLVKAYLADAYSWIPGSVERGLALAEGLATRGDVSAFSLVALSEAFYFTRPDLCIRILERAYALDPDSMNVRLALASAYNWDRHLRQADKILATFTERERESDPSLLYLLGVQARFKGDSELGKRCLERSAHQSGVRSYRGAWLFWAEILWQAGDFEEAERIFREGLRIAPENFMLRRIFAQFLDETGKYDEALQHFCLALPDESVFEFWQVKEIQRSLSRLLRWKPRPRDLSPLDAFVDAYGKFEEDRYPPLVCENLALARLLAPQRRDVSKARALAERAVVLSERKNPEILSTLAMVQFEQGEREAAVRTLEEAAASPAAKTQCFGQLADYRKILLPRSVSFASCDAALEAVSGDPVRERATIDSLRNSASAKPLGAGLVAYVEGRASELEGDIDGAVVSFKKAAMEVPGRGAPSLRIAAALCRANRPTDAQETLRTALAAGCEPAWDLWTAWLRVCDKDLKLTPSQMLERFPIAKGATPLPQFADDMRWLLEGLSAGTPLAIDCGSDEDGEFDGKRWSRDRFFVGDSKSIKATEPIDPRPVGPHRTSHFFDEDFSFGGYRIPLPCGKYRVTLLFAEYRNDRSNLDAWIEGERVMQCYQALREVGWATPDRRVFDVEVTDGVLDIRLTAAEGRRQFPVSIAGVEVESERDER